MAQSGQFQWTDRKRNRRSCNGTLQFTAFLPTHVDELVEVWYPLDGVADDEDDGDGQADLGQSDLLLPR